MPPENTSKVPVGTVLGGKFRVTREIGRGGMAAVYEAENIVIGKRVAVKLLAAELMSSRVVRERFLREARAAAAIRSPYICDVYDSGTFDERPFLVMELLEGESLYEMMTRVRRIDIDTTLTVLTHTARGLAQAHEVNVVHRDLKPENIFITRTPEGEVVTKIVDFGLAKFYEPTGADAVQVRLTREGALFGTPAYMSPEQAKGHGEVDGRTDLWALGCIAYECLTGQTVWNVENGVAMILAQIAGAPIPRPSRLRRDLPASFDSWFLKALDRDVDKRFQTAKEFADSLAEALKPKRTSDAGAPSVSSEAEQQSIDDLLGTAPTEEPPSAVVRPSPGAAPPVGSVPGLERSASDPGAESPRQGGERAPGTPTSEPTAVPDSAPPPNSSAGGAIGALLLVASIAIGAYGVWLYVLHPPPTTLAPQATTSAGLAPSSSGAAPAASAGAPAPLETEPWAATLSQAQLLLASGERDKALSAFNDAFKQSQGGGVARGLLSQAGAGLIDNSSKCKLTGVGRPRPFDDLTTVSRPSLAVVPGGVVAVWVDNHLDVRRRQAVAVTLDHTLRRSSPVRLVTPEATSVRHVQLYPVDQQLALLYWDDGGGEPGVYARLLERDGRIAGPAHRLTSITKTHEFEPSLTRTSDRGFYAVWAEPTEPGVTDLWGRRLSATLEPLGDPVRLTAHEGVRSLEIGAQQPDVTVSGGLLLVTYARRRDHDWQVMLLTVPEKDPSLSRGVTARAKDEKPGDRFVGQRRPVGAEKGKSAQPRIACAADGCFIVWDDEKAGAFAAYVDAAKGEPLWHREFARKGTRPEVANGAAGTYVAWFEGLHVRLARITRDGLEAASNVAKVSGFQPYPELVPGSAPGEWYLAWRDFESAHFEVYVARAGCP